MAQIRLSARDAIIEAAFEIFGKDPTATLGDVAKHAGVGRATLHRHFKGRIDLMAALSITAMEEMDVAIDEATKNAASHTEGLKLAMAAAIPLGGRQWFLALEQAQFSPEIATAYQESLAGLATEIDAARSEGIFGEHVPTQWLVEIYENLIFAAWTMVKKEQATPSQAAKLAWDTFILGNGAQS